MYGSLNFCLFEIDRKKSRFFGSPGSHYKILNLPQKPNRLVSFGYAMYVLYDTCASGIAPWLTRLGAAHFECQGVLGSCGPTLPHLGGRDASQGSQGSKWFRLRGAWVRVDQDIDFVTARTIKDIIIIAGGVTEIL